MGTGKGDKTSRHNWDKIERERAGDTEHENKQTWNHGRPNMEDPKGRT